MKFNFKVDYSIHLAVNIFTCMKRKHVYNMLNALLTEKTYGKLNSAKTDI